MVLRVCGFGRIALVGASAQGAAVPVATLTALLNVPAISVGAFVDKVRRILFLRFGLGGLWIFNSLYFSFLNSLEQKRTD